jgi:hypothetical protein
VRATTLGAILALSIGFAACAGVQKGQDTRRIEISNLSTQIRDWRHEAGLPVDPRREDVIQMYNTPMKSAEPVCSADHSVPTTCGDVCSLADAICDNAEQICILADELKDQWSADKCASAKASCREAKKNCCKKCSEEPKTASEPKSDEPKATP